MGLNGLTTPLKSSRTLHDGLILTASGVIILLIALYMDAFEMLASWAATYEAWELDEVLFTVLVISVGIGIFTFRRWTDLNREVRMRILAEERLKLAIQGGELGIWDWDMATGKVTVHSITDAWNGDTFREEMIPAAEIETRVHPEDSPVLLQRMGEVTSKNEPFYESECRVPGKDGTWRWVHIRGKVMSRGEGGRPVRVAGILRDITDAKLAQDALAEANKKSTLLSSITRHDVINQICVIAAYAHFLSDELPASGQQGEYLRRILTATGAIQDQIAFMQDYRSMGAGSPVYCCVSTVVERAYQNASPCDIGITISTGTLEVFADPMFEKVFFNLVDNTIRHGDGATRIQVSFHEEGGTGVIVYEDDGAGIPISQKEKIFDRGFGRNSGLGLFLVREILGITGMTIRETGTEGKGVRFEVLVPAGKYRTDQD
ncbi:sensor histidine kinase KdpD [uncultured Methanofollis sp.]|uniref:sensor histidine kinase n=1 Tax=uncultured Methanofollis sp. TaxID=262500 RepID=UPI002612D385|nr:ATP-binding protein [uncultured Methanofollis sp.]